MEELFRGGSLNMSIHPSEEMVEAIAWGDVLTNRILAVIAVILLVASLPNLFRLFPVLFFSFRQTRGAVAVEHGISMARIRNLTALIFLLPFCLVADHYALFRPDFWSAVPAGWSAPALFAGMVLYLLVRAAGFALWHPRQLNGEAYAALRHQPYNYFILLTALMLIFRFLLPACGLNELAINRILYLLIAFFWCFSLLRSVQFLASYSADFSSILYLCALEILPAALVLATILLF